MGIYHFKDCNLFQMQSFYCSVSDPEYSDKTTEMPTNKRKYKYEYNFMCDMCPYSTTSKQRILDHLLRHVKYKCQICPER